MGMCTEETTRKIVTEGLADFTERNKMPAVVKILLAIIITAFGSAIGFNTTTLYAMKDTVNNARSSIRNDILTVVAKNTALITQIQYWQKNHAISKSATVEMLDLRINHNEMAIDEIVLHKADNRWRLNDEIADNKLKEEIHKGLKKEDEYIRQLMNERCELINSRLYSTEESIDEMDDAMDKINNMLIKHINKNVN